MTFTAMSLPMWATLMASIGGVITLLYMLRLRRRKIEVPFGPLWQKVLTEKQTTSLFRVLKRIFSLLLQLIFVAAVLTAIAAPKWVGGDLWAVDYQEPREPEPSHTLLVVDTSASMSATDVKGGRLNEALAAAREVVASRRTAESFMIARMDRDVTALTDWSTDVVALQKVLDGIEAYDTGTRLDPLMQFARNAVRGLPNARVVLVTDRGFEPPDAELAASIHLQVIAVDAKKHVDNLAVLDFNVRSHVGNALKYAIYYKLRNYSDKPVKAAVYLYGDPDGTSRTREHFQERPPAMTPFYHELGPGEEKVVEKVAVDIAGVRAMLFVEPWDTKAYDDVMPADNAAYAVVPQRKKVQVLLVGEENLFLLAGLVTRGFVSVDRVDYETYQSSKGYDLTVFAGGAPADHDAANAIYLNANGQGVPFTLRGSGKRVVVDSEPSVPTKARHHGVMKYVKFVDVTVDTVQPLRRSKGDVVLAKVKGGRPAVMAHSDEKARWVAVAFDPLGSEWVLRYSYPIFMVNALNWFFAEEVKLIRPWSLAERWDVRVPWKSVDAVRVLTPRGDTVTALVDAGGTLAFTGDEEGVYEVQHPDEASGEPPIVVAAALRSPTESALLSKGEYGKWVPPELETPETDEIRILGANLWQLLVLFALGLMAVEWFTYHRRWTV